VLDISTENLLQTEAEPNQTLARNYLCTRNLLHAVPRSRNGLLRAVSVNSTSQLASPSIAVLQWQTTSQVSSSSSTASSTSPPRTWPSKPAHLLQPSACLSALHWAAWRVCLSVLHTGQELGHGHHLHWDQGGGGLHDGALGEGEQDQDLSEGQDTHDMPSQKDES